MYIQEPDTRTHRYLKKLLTIANKNYSRKKPGYRFDEDLKSFATYIRLLAGPLAYSTIHRNFELAIPSLSTTNLFARKKAKCIFNGHLRTKELLEYLNKRNLPLAVAIAEDLTVIDGRIQYDAKSNQIVGFKTPIDKATGMPIADSYPARNIEEILKHFSSGLSAAQYVNVVMAQPLANCPAFCLLVYAKDSSNTAEDVMNRWNFIDQELAKANIKVLSVSTDSDPRYNSAMRKCSLLGHESHIFDESKKVTGKNWFRSGLSQANRKPFNFQDYVHIVTKMKNFFLKTARKPLMLPYGKYHIQISHLNYLLKHFGKDKHLLTKSVLNPVDRQNYDSVVRMCSEKVIHLLENKVPGSAGTVMFLKMIRNIIEAFSKNALDPLERLYKMWYTLFSSRIWRRFICLRKRATLKEIFLTQNCYACIEINAHNLILEMLHLKEINKPECFLPFLCNSQTCEAFFRRVRSFTSTYSTKANCSVKEILGRIDKIQLLDDISNNTQFEYPRIKSTHQFPNHTFDLPSEREILNTIIKCQTDAANDAIKLGLLEKNYSVDCFACELAPVKIKEPSNENVRDIIPRQLIPLKRVDLSNYADKFHGKVVPENSPYVELQAINSKRQIVKKTSILWLLRPEQQKLSSDRLIRVRGQVKSKSIKVLRTTMNATSKSFKTKKK